MRLGRALTAVLAVGCNYHEFGAAETDGPSTAASTGLASTGDDLVTISGVVSESTPGPQSDVPLADVTVCGREPVKNCTTSGPDGDFAIADIPPGARGLAEFSKPGYVPTLAVVQIPSNDVTGTGIIMFAEATIESFFALAGVERVSDTGFATVIVPGTAGVSFTVSPDPGTAPVYLDDNGLPDPGATSTSSPGIAALVNLPPGEYQVTATAPGMICAHEADLPGWPADPPGPAAFPIEAGKFTGPIQIRCHPA